MDVKVIRAYFDRERGNVFSPGTVIKNLDLDRAQKLISKNLVESIQFEEKADMKMKDLKIDKV